MFNSNLASSVSGILLSIINNFIGNLKKVSKIVHYKHYIEEDKGTAERLFYNGSIPLDFNKYRGKGEQQLQELTYHTRQDFLPSLELKTEVSGEEK